MGVIWFMDRYLVYGSYLVHGQVQVFMTVTWYMTHDVHFTVTVLSHFPGKTTFHTVFSQCFQGKLICKSALTDLTTDPQVRDRLPRLPPPGGRDHRGRHPHQQDGPGLQEGLRPDARAPLGGEHGQLCQRRRLLPLQLRRGQGLRQVGVLLIRLQCPILYLGRISVCFVCSKIPLGLSLWTSMYLAVPPRPRPSCTASSR